MADRLLMNKAYPKMNLTNNENAIKSICGKFMQINQDALSSTGPQKQIYFTKEVQTSLMELFNQDDKEINAIMKESKGFIDGAMTINPFNVSCAMSIRWAIEHKKEKLKTNLIFILAMFYYPLLYRKYFTYDPNPSIMEYTISNMTNKYKVKQYGLFRSLQDTIANCVQHHQQGLLKGDDIEFTKFLNACRTRMNQFFNNIKGQYEDARLNNHAILLRTTDTSGEEFLYAENDSFIIDQTTQNTVNNIILKLDNNIALIKYAANINKVSENEMKNYLWKLVNRKTASQEIKTVVECLIRNFIQDQKMKAELIRGQNFFNKSMEMFKGGIVRYPQVQGVLEKWNAELGVNEDYRRIPTRTQYKRAFYTFIVLSVSASYK